MIDSVIRIIDRLLLLFAPRGRHRLGQRIPAPEPRPTPPPTPPRCVAPFSFDAPIDASGTVLVRPYVLTREQRRRRRALWLATHGVDVGPRRIHGREVAR